MSFNYLRPGTISELSRLKKQYGAAGCLMAGGTDVMVKINAGHLRPEAVISLSRVKNLKGDITKSARGVTIGALATLTDIVKNKTVQKYFPALVQAAEAVGSRQIRNRATLAGNICNASPAADTATPLLVYEAVVSISNGTRIRKVAIGSFFTGPGKTVLKKGEVVTGIFLPFPKQKSKSSFRRTSRREGVDLAIVGAAGMVTADGSVRLALGAVGPKPVRVIRTEKLISKKGLTEKAWDLLWSEVSPIDDIRSGKEYRLAMVRELTRQILTECGIK